MAHAAKQPAAPGDGTEEGPKRVQHPPTLERVSSGQSRDWPFYTFEVPEDVCRKAIRGTRIESDNFVLGDLPGEFSLRFFPKGHSRSRPQHCALYLHSTAGVEVQAVLHMNEYQRTLGKTGPFPIEPRGDSGWSNFTCQVEDEAMLAVVVLAWGRGAKPFWPLPRHLKLDKLLGVGSYGAVREAWDAKGERRVAVKQLVDVFSNEEEAKRILREVAILSQLEHPNVVCIYDIIEPKPVNRLSTQLNQLYICMEMCDTDLKKVCMYPQGLSLPVVRKIVRTLCHGVSYLHSKGVYHRDLKPANCLVNRDCTVKICDFNLARVVDDAIPLTHGLTGGVGTRWYRPPEVILAQAYTTSVDVWSVGCILVELFRVLNTGGRTPTPKPLFRAKSSWPLDGHREPGDMLDKIFDVLGTPFEDPSYEELPPMLRRSLERYDARPGTSLRAALPAETSEEGVELAEGMLQFFPHRRLTMDAALECRFLHDSNERRRRPSTDAGQTAAQHLLDLGFDDSQVSTSAEIRMEMRHAVDRLHGHAASEVEQPHEHAAADNEVPVGQSRMEEAPDTKRQEGGHLVAQDAPDVKPNNSGWAGATELAPRPAAAQDIADVKPREGGQVEATKQPPGPAASKEQVARFGPPARSK